MQTSYAFLIGVYMDWNHLHAFLQTAERGSLSAAARHMGVTQSTLSRQVAALEQQLGVTLFERVGRSVAVTQAGSGLLEYARTMEAAAQDLALAATGASTKLDGVVSVSATDAVAAFLLPRAIQRINEILKLAEVTVVGSLLNRSDTADIAVGQRLRFGPVAVAVVGVGVLQCLRAAAVEHYRWQSFAS